MFHQNIFLIGEWGASCFPARNGLTYRNVIPISKEPQPLFQHDGSVLILLNFLFLPLAQWRSGQLHPSYEVDIEVLQVLPFCPSNRDYLGLRILRTQMYLSSRMHLDLLFLNLNIHTNMNTHIDLFVDCCLHLKKNAFQKKKTHLRTIHSSKTRVYK